MQLSGRGHGGVAHVAPEDAGDSGALSRYRLPLSGNVCLSRPQDGSLASEFAQSGREANRSRSGRAIRDIESHRSWPLLPSAQSRTAFRRARELRRLVHRAAARTIADAKEFEIGGASPVAKRQSAPESESAGCVDLG